MSFQYEGRTNTRNLVNVGIFFCRQDLSIFIFGRTKEYSEVSGMSLMCNLGVRSLYLDVIYGVRGSPALAKISGSAHEVNSFQNRLGKHNSRRHGAQKALPNIFPH